jgi:hypothetical protein
VQRDDAAPSARSVHSRPARSDGKKYAKQQNCPGLSSPSRSRGPHQRHHRRGALCLPHAVGADRRPLVKHGRSPWQQVGIALLQSGRLITLPEG